jgi:integrase/recombinase XerD
MIQKAREQWGVDKKVTPHWLRHTNAALALQRYLHTVQQIKKAAPDYVEDSLKDHI